MILIVLEFLEQTKKEIYLLVFPMKLTKISATLGPTNTGKTFSAIEKLLTYSNLF